MCIRKNGEKLELGLWEKSEQFFEVKEELADDMVEKRQREEEVVNWSFVLKYLLSTNSKLRRQLSGRDALRGLLDDSSASMSSSVVGRSGMKEEDDGEEGHHSVDVTPTRNNRGLHNGKVGGGGGVGPMLKSGFMKLDSSVDVSGLGMNGVGDESADTHSLAATPIIIGAAAQTPRTREGHQQQQQQQQHKQKQKQKQQPQTQQNHTRQKGKLANSEEESDEGEVDSVQMSPDRVKQLLPNEKVAQALINRVKQMTEADIEKLPPSARLNVWQLRREFGIEGNSGGSMGGGEGGSVKKVAIQADTPTSFRVSPIASKSAGGGRGGSSKARQYQDSDGESEEESDEENYSQI